MARQKRGHEITVIEQNPRDATFGYGVVFSRGALEFLARDEPQMHATLTAAFESWSIQRIVHRDVAVEIDGNGFSALGRLRLLNILQKECEGAGVRLVFDKIFSPDEIEKCDLLVAADGANSLVRRLHEKQFKPNIEILTNKFAWYGTPKRFECLTLTFRGCEHGAFVAHHYRHAPDMSTFVVECDAATWQRAGLGGMSDEESRAYCERVFAPDLGGELLVSNKSIWRNFPLLRNETWFSGNKVLIGDALRTGHFSIGSGTRLAIDDAIALAKVFENKNIETGECLKEFEKNRRPIVEKIVSAATASAAWYEHFAEHMELAPAEFAMSYIMRSGRIDIDRLRKLSPRFVAQYEQAVRNK